MITVSLCMIVKDEESVLGNCLDSVKDLVDEIIIVDTGSSDKTKESAARYTDKIYDFKWIDDFSAARNYSYEQATMEYILWLDADDIILPEDGAKFKGLKRILPEGVDAVMMKYNTGFDSAGNVTFSFYRERLSKRNDAFKWKEPVHEYLDAGWRRITSDICITHTKTHSEISGRNLRIYEKILADGKNLTPRGMYYYARELKDCSRYADAIKHFNIFLDSGAGWSEDNITACGELAKCYLMENNGEAALSALLRSFSYDLPRAEICCQIGYYFKGQGKYRQAAFWFRLILSLDKKDSFLGFRNEDAWGYIPCRELAVCHYRLGEYEKAAEYNNMAGIYKPSVNI